MNWNKIQLIGIIAVTIFCLVMLGTSSKAEEHLEMPPGQWDYSQFFVKAVTYTVVLQKLYLKGLKKSLVKSQCQPHQFIHTTQTAQKALQLG